jgi:beta-N-acetylhexosaminidase
MIHPLTPRQTQWVDHMLSTLSLEGCVAQMLNISRREGEAAYWFEFIDRIPMGCMTARTETAEAYRALLAEIQGYSPIPVLVLANMEHGATDWAGYGTDFPPPMALGAAGDEALAAAMGEAIAREARYVGVNWVLNPVVDLNYNPRNPITNTRSMGDHPDRVCRLAPAWIEALQAHGVAATAKHFPGDGMDDRDQHLVSTVNHLPFAQWMETYGQVWKAAIDAGVWTIMPGHISLPDYQGYASDPEAAPPATISRRLLTDLLRGELGFQGLIVSDSTSMVGLTSRAAPEERAVAAIEAGIDVYLNADPQVDYPALLQAVADRRLSEERIRGSARRMLELKARLNLFVDPFGPEPTEAERVCFRDAAQAIADKSITLLRGDGRPPVQLKPGAKVLAVTVSAAQANPMRRGTDLSVFEDELRQRGYAVETLVNPRTDEVREAAQRHDAVFVGIDIPPGRQTPGFGTWGWRALFMEHPQVCYTLFGNPYVAHELPHVPALLAAYGGSPELQRAAVQVWLGEMEAQGSLPIRLPKVRISSLPARTFGG